MVQVIQHRLLSPLATMVHLYVTHCLMVRTTTPNCQLCRTEGHYAHACPSLSSFAQGHSPTMTDLAQAFQTSLSVSNFISDWYVDSDTHTHDTHTHAKFCISSTLETPTAQPTYHPISTATHTPNPIIPTPTELLAQTPSAIEPKASNPTNPSTIVSPELIKSTPPTDPVIHSHPC